MYIQGKTAEHEYSCALNSFGDSIAKVIDRKDNFKFEPESNEAMYIILKMVSICFRHAETRGGL